MKKFLFVVTLFWISQSCHSRKESHVLQSSEDESNGALISVPDWEKANYVSVGFYVDTGQGGWLWHYINRKSNNRFNVVKYSSKRLKNGLLVGDIEVVGKNTMCSNITEGIKLKEIHCDNVKLLIPDKHVSEAPFNVLVENERTYSHACRLSKATGGGREICDVSIKEYLTTLAQKTCLISDYKGCSISSEIEFKTSLTQLGASDNLRTGKLSFNCTDNSQDTCISANP